MKRQQFLWGLFGLFSCLAIFSFLKNPDGYNFSENIISSIGSGAGGLIAILLFGGIVWAIIRSIRGLSKTPEIKSFLLKFSAVFSAIYIISAMVGIIKG
jgi:uncharacterized membrane protein